MYQKAVAEGGLAVVTGAASGVGLAAALRFAEAGLGVLLADLPGDRLDAAAEDVQKVAGPDVPVLAVPTDVSDKAQVEHLADTAFQTGQVAVLMNNAGIGLPSKTWEDSDAWTRMMDVNFFGVLRGVQSFTQRMIDAGRPAVIINTGSKQGITTPPGNPGYNVTKAAVKVLSEQLAHELREAGAPISVHLFVPGFTYTGMIASWLPEKPASAWTSDETVGYFIDRMSNGEFYILCPDNDVDSLRDKRRAEWAIGDIVENRPPLSRWHPDYKEAFAEFEKTGKS
ncbi:SDR family NAD(P)-dependent oxidoreductase [Labrenzia sp. DG1229]|uniref:SDR family NAD(P)-dependent oxidoreductase n=1 Tax=Labrenzia sp. DG1229 TaxID=681847 RepID=UPI00048CAB7A|nr:SDR family NAD(P)-dependent oxidoreductase [Labrenzia sp. DG1229]